MRSDEPSIATERRIRAVLKATAIGRRRLNRDVLWNSERAEKVRAMSETLDAILDSCEPHGTFHDAFLVDTKHSGEATELHFSLCVGDPDATTEDDRERRRSGLLILHGVHDWIFDPPDANLGSWMTSDGRIADLDSDVSRRLTRNFPPDLLHHYLYFSDMNAFLFVACDRMEFHWC